MTIGERIKEKRKELNLSQEDLAKKAGYKDKTAISKFEHKGNDITMKQVKRVASALGVSAAYLMGWEDVAPDLMVNDVYIIECYSKMSSDNKKRLESYATFLMQQEEGSGGVED